LTPSWQWSAYEWLSALVVGVLAVLTAAICSPAASACFLMMSKTASGIFVSLAVALTAGHVLQALSRAIWSLGRIQHGPALDAFSRLSRDEREAIDRALTEFYGFAPTSANRDRLCIAPVHDRVAKRSSFLAIAAFYRGTALLAAVGGLIAAGHIVRGSPAWPSVLAAVGSLAVCVLSVSSSRVFRRWGDTIMYTAFLSWWSERADGALAGRWMYARLLSLTIAM